MGKISWTEKKNKPTIPSLSGDSFVKIYPIECKKENTEVSSFMFINGCHKAITRTKCLKVGISLEEKRLYFAEAFIDEGYTVNEFKGETPNHVMQIRKNAYPDLFDVVTKYKGMYLLKKDESGIYINLQPSEEKPADIAKVEDKKVEDKEVEENTKDDKFDILLSGLNQMYKVQEAILEQIKQQNEILKQMNSDVHSGTEKVKAIFTEVKYNIGGGRQ